MYFLTHNKYYVNILRSHIIHSYIKFGPNLKMLAIQQSQIYPKTAKPMNEPSIFPLFNC